MQQLSQHEQFLQAQRCLMGLLEQSDKPEALADKEFQLRLLNAEIRFDKQRERLAQQYRKLSLRDIM